MPDFLSFLKEDKPQAGQKATANDFLSGLRNQGYFDLGGDLYTTKSNADFAHNTVMIVYRASTYISDFVTMIPWEIKSKKSGEVTATHKDPDGHPLSVAITQQYVKSKQPFFALWSKALSLAGENYIEPIKEQNVLTGRIGTRYVALDWLQPALVDPYTMYGILQGFYYSAHGRSEFFQPHELVYDHLYNAVDENRGWSPVLAAMNEVNLDRDSKRAFKSWFRNGMLPPVIFSPAKEDGMLGTGIDGALDKLREQLKEKHRGAGNAYRSLVLNYPVDVTTVNQPDINRNVDILQYWKHEIANAFGLPPVVLGDTSATPFKDAPEILAAAYSGAVRSQLVRMEASVNIELMPFFDDSGEFILEFDKEKYEKLGDDLQKNQDLQNQAYETGAITLATYRQRIGATQDDESEEWDALPDMVKVPGILAPVPLSELENLWKEFLPSTQSKLDQDLAQAKPPPGGPSPPQVPMLNAGKANFQESDVVRDEGGQFADEGGGGGAEADDEEKPEGETPRDKVRIQRDPPPDAIDDVKLDEWENSLTTKEAEAVSGWSVRDYGRFGDLGRGAEVDFRGEEFSPEVKQRFAEFEAAVESAPAYNGTSWRGLSIEGDEASILADFKNKIGQDITFDTYSSASASTGIAGGFAGEFGSGGTIPVMFEITSNKGKYIAPATLSGGRPSSERELIFQPGSQFSVQDAFIGGFGDPAQQAIFVTMGDS